MREIDRILAETIKDEVGAEFMAPAAVRGHDANLSKQTQAKKSISELPERPPSSGFRRQFDRSVGMHVGASQQGNPWLLSATK